MPRARVQKRHVRKLLQGRGLGASTKKSTRGRKSAKPVEVERTGGGTTATKRSKAAKRAKATKPSVKPPAAPALAATIVEVKPPGVPEHAPYPVDALPATLRDFVESTVAIDKVAPASAALPVLVVTMAAIGNSVRSRGYYKWHEPIAAFCALIGPSGVRKAPAVVALERLIQDVEERVEGHPHAVNAHGLPESSLMVTSSISEARLIQVMKEQPRGIILLRDELAALFADGASAVAKNFEFHLLQGYDGRTHRKEIMRKREESEGPPPVVLMSILGAMPPAQYVAIMRTNRRLSSGLAARFWVVYPPRVKRFHSIPAPESEASHPAIEERLRNVLVRLRTIRFDGLEGSLVHFTEEASQRLVDFMNAQEELIVLLCDESVERSQRSKSHGWVSRVACTLALVRAAEEAEARAAIVRETLAREATQSPAAVAGPTGAEGEPSSTVEHAHEGALDEPEDGYDLEDAGEAIDTREPPENPVLDSACDHPHRCVPGDDPLDASKVKVTLVDVEAAIRMIDWQLGENIRVLHELDLEVPRSAIDKSDAIATKALGTGKFASSLSVYELAKAAQLTRAESEGMLESLVSAGRWERFQPPISKLGGAPSRHYRRRSSAA